MEVEGRVVIKCQTTINLPYEKCKVFFKDPTHVKYLQENSQKL